MHDDLIDAMMYAYISTDHGTTWEQKYGQPVLKDIVEAKRLIEEAGQMKNQDIVWAGLTDSVVGGYFKEGAWVDWTFGDFVMSITGYRHEPPTLEYSSKFKGVVIINRRMFPELEMT